MSPQSGLLYLQTPFFSFLFFSLLPLSSVYNMNCESLTLLHLQVKDPSDIIPQLQDVYRTHNHSPPLLRTYHP
jgi:hypothetical protein